MINSSAKKILLITPTSSKSLGGFSFAGPHLGVLRLAGFLNARGQEAECFDTNLRTVTGKGKTLEEKLAEKTWDIIGVSFLDETLERDIDNFYLAKKIRPFAKLVAGGIEAQFNYQTLLDNSPCDIVVQGEGEIPLLMLAEGTPPGEIPGMILKNRARALDEVLFNEATNAIEWEDIDYESYWDYWKDYYQSKGQYTDLVETEIHTVRVFARNRCPIGCKYCSSTGQLTAATGGNVPVISSTDENLIEVVERIVEAHPRVRTIYFTDDDFCINVPAAIRFVEKLAERDFSDLTFMCYARITDITEKLAAALKKANFRLLYIGVETFSETVLKEIGKLCSADQVHQGLKIMKDYDLKPYFNIILTTPGSKLIDVRESVYWSLKYIADDFYKCTVVSAIEPLKGTEFAARNWDFKSRIIGIEDGANEHFIRRDELIWPEDPFVRLILERYIDGVQEETARQVERDNVIHQRLKNVATYQLLYMERLLREICEEYPEAVRQFEGVEDSFEERIAHAL